MRASIYYSLIAIMLLAVPICAYEYHLYSEMETEQIKTDTLLSATDNNTYGAKPFDANEIINDDRSTLGAEKMGFLGATVSLFLIPSLMLVFRGKLLK